MVHMQLRQLRLVSRRDVYVTGNKRNQGFHVTPKQLRDYV